MKLPAPALPLFLCPLLAPLLCAAQPPRQPDAAQLLRRVERLGVVGNVLYVAAHPDDENTRLLSYLANERLLRTAYLSLTRGDGGQNLIGAEQGPLLGLIRTQELLAARRIDGAEQFFTRARDFGYSKTPQETLALWGRDEVLADVVWVIRRFRPDVIVTRFPPGPAKGNETHGHHTASAILAAEAFRAAADPAFHPEQLAAGQEGMGTAPWQARRLLWNRFQWADRPAEELAGSLKLDLGAYNPFLGLSYGEMAAESRSMHKSQGFGAARSRGPSPEYFQPLLGVGAPAKQGILDGLDLSWGRIKGAERLAQLLREALRRFEPARPAAIVPTLLQARAELVRLPDNPWKGPKLQELDEVLVACAGLWLEAAAEDFAAVPGGEVKVRATALNRSRAALRLEEVRLAPGGVVPVGKDLGPNAPLELLRGVALPADLPYSDPYWLAQPPQPGRYSVREQRLVGLPEAPPALRAEFVLSAGGQRFTIARAIAYPWTDPVAGERYRPVEVGPPVTLSPRAGTLMFPDGQPCELRVLLKAAVASAEGAVRLELPPGFRAAPASLPFQLGSKGAEEEVRFQVRPAETGSTCGGALRVAAEVGGRRLDRGVARIEYPHIPIQTLFPAAEVRLCRFDLKKGGTRIGYVPGAGDEVAAALRQVGYEVTLLDDEALAGQALGRFDAIVTGVRAWNTNPRLPFQHRRLMDYVAAGGTLVVQYNTNNRLSRLQAPIGPYPFDISQDRVTDENAAVAFDAPEHPLLRQPNRIGAGDFAGWVQERGLYFAGRWDPKYQTVLSMHDPGEAPRRGALLVARHGKGAFVYTGLAFFRQLPAGVPGAYRLFANLLAYGRNPAPDASTDTGR